MSDIINFTDGAAESRRQKSSDSGKKNERPRHQFDFESWVDRLDAAEDEYRAWRVFAEERIRKQIPKKEVADPELKEIQHRIDELMVVLGFPKNGNGEQINDIDISTEFGRRKLERVWNENVVEWDEMCKLMRKEDKWLGE